jgi:cytoskeletal protein CcmA (bactofilin family)
MFTRKPRKGGGAAPGEGTPEPRDARQRRASATPSIIGPDLSIVGNLASAGEVQINGEVQGDIQAGRIIVGQEAHIVGELLADDIVVGGNVQGSIRGNSVRFQTASHIEGDVFHKTLFIEQGAYFEGKSRRSDDPMSM